MVELVVGLPLRIYRLEAGAGRQLWKEVMPTDAVALAGVGWVVITPGRPVPRLRLHADTGRTLCSGSARFNDRLLLGLKGTMSEAELIRVARTLARRNPEQGPARRAVCPASNGLCL